MTYRELIGELIKLFRHGEYVSPTSSAKWELTDLDCCQVRADDLFAGYYFFMEIHPFADAIRDDWDEVEKCSVVSCMISKAATSDELFDAAGRFYYSKEEFDKLPHEIQAECLFEENAMSKFEEPIDCAAGKDLFIRMLNVCA